MGALNEKFTVHHGLFSAVPELKVHRVVPLHGLNGFSRRRATRRKKFRRQMDRNPELEKSPAQPC